MNKKNVATTFVLILCAILFAVVGSSFLTFVYEKAKIVIKNPKVIISEGVQVYSSKDKDKKTITVLEFSDAQLGLKPCTGSPDAETGIPSTVTDQNGTEGVYASVKVTAPIGLRIVINNIKIESQEEPDKIKEERENMFVALKDIEDSAFNFKEDSLTLVTTLVPSDETEYTILFWLDGKAGEILKGCKISFDVCFLL